MAQVIEITLTGEQRLGVGGDRGATGRGSGARILGTQSLGRTDFHSKRALRDHLDAYMRAWNKSPTPFAWTKPADAIIKSHRRMLKRISTAVC
jgi:hypothetical protein